MNGFYVKFAPETIEQARQIDLLTYLQHNERDNLVKISRNVYCTKEHDSLKISNGKWYWWSRGFGGHSALDYLIKVKEYDFTSAVETLVGISVSFSPPSIIHEKVAPKILTLPPKYVNNKRVINYLSKRGIDRQLILDCIKRGIIYESADYHNAIFVGQDAQGVAKYAACRSITGRDFKGDASGSDKRYSFCLVADDHSCQSVHLFESAIDLLSYATYLKLRGIDYKAENLLSLSGVYQPSKDAPKSEIPIALYTYLKENPQIKIIILHLDNDKIGRIATQTIMDLLQNDYEIVDDPPPTGKDCNDFLLSYVRSFDRKKIQKAHERTKFERGDAR